MTFLGFYIDVSTQNLVDPSLNKVLAAHIMTKELMDSLVRNKVPLAEEFTGLDRYCTFDVLITSIHLYTEYIITPSNKAHVNINTVQALCTAWFSLSKHHKLLGMDIEQNVTCTSRRACVLARKSYILAFKKS